MRHRSSSMAKKRSFKTGLALLLMLLLLSAICVSLLYAAKGNHRPRGTSPRRPAVRSEEAKTFQGSLHSGRPHFQKTAGGKFVEDRDPYHFVYSVDAALQNRVAEIFRTYRPPYATFVALEPKTGKILALADYVRGSGENGGVWQRATYPAASVFKLVTAAGALEKGLLRYDSPVSFRGNLYRLGPDKLVASSRRDRQTHFDEALGKSNNVVFGRIASNMLGAQTLRHYSEAFGFNQPIRFDFPLEMSRAVIPESSLYELARCGAGFGEVTLNPLHAAMIASSIANRGVMMRPLLVEEVRDGAGENLYQAQPEVAAQPIAAQTARELSRMMARTVEDGTASKTFRRYGKSLLKRMSICGKTGHLTGDNPPGLYDWFVGFAPADDPRIAFATLVIHDVRWKVKGAYVASEALKAFFREG